MSTMSMFLGQEFDFILRNLNFILRKKIDVIQSKTKNGLLNKIKSSLKKNTVNFFLLVLRKWAPHMSAANIPALVLMAL